MKPFSNREKKRLLSKLSWDLDIKAEQLFQLLNGEIENIDGIDKSFLYRRLLTTYDWYTLLKLVPNEKYNQMLDDSVLDGLFPKELKEKFIYVRRVLSE